jgi:eukaryotic-like serine/threonine-protein kinase
MRLGVYEVTAPIGEGGMGQVFRARDTKLNRDVALKVLPDFLGSDTERLARFTREAQTLALLNHPHIAQIYGLEESGGVRALVMELVEGEDLSQRIARGAIPLDEVLPLAKQIAEALEAAHEQGIIHRDLKPANIKVRPDGTVKVLDFGLAKATEPMSGSSPNVSQSPTLTTPAMTQAGMILGTAAYMSPEQAKGRAADRRSDVWAFGVVLYEMLTGQRAFKGDDVSDTLAFILTRAPDWTTLPAGTPPPIRRLLHRCMEKDRKRRLADASDARLEIEEALAAPAASEGAATPSPTVPRSFWKRAIPMVTAAVVTSAMVGAAVWMLKPTPPLAVTRFAFTLGENQQLSVGNQAVAMSPDGRLLVYVANDQLYLRSMSDLEARPIPGTRQTPTPYNPVFSPDGQFIAFYSQVDRTIKKIAVSGGAAVRIGPAPIELLGMTWDAGGIVFTGGLRESGNPVRIMRVSANGGQPDVLVKAKDLGEVMYGPQVLPGGE